MSVDDLQIGKATTSDLDEILELLRCSSLPPDGVEEHLSDFFVGRDSTGRLVACAAVERYGALGLLRSVAVSTESQKSGLGSLLVRKVLDEAQRTGIDEVVLLTTTARDFFARRFGFGQTTREPYTAQLAGSIEWQLPRCSSAVVMSLRLIQESTA
jgi:amino-acid N-acetyltransferase